MNDDNITGTAGPGDLLFLPLGGSGEIGMNLNLYGHDGQWLMVDLGISFGDSSTPGVDVIMPDPAFIEERRDALVGLVLTHAHEDHLGAVQYLWPRLRCPVYATPFTAAFLRRKLAKTDFADDIEITEVPLSGHFSVGSFAIELVSLTHSILEPNALIIRTPAGNIMHTGDWKLDPDPVLGPTADEDALIRAGEEGILAMVCDSTNALDPGWSGSEGAIRQNLVELVRELSGRVVIACFASNVARLESAAKAGLENGRKVALAGRSLWRIVDAARETGYLKDLPPFLEAEEVAKFPPDKILLICTGSQGEPRAALSRIAHQNHRDISLSAGDSVIFSSRAIPGNEAGISRIQNLFIAQGVEVITAKERAIHSSGHPNQDELAQMYQWIRPEIAIPVHGEARHLHAHARLARECQVPHAVVVENGMCLSLTGAGVDVVDKIYSGRLYLDGTRLMPMGNMPLRTRRKMAWNGFVLASLVVDDDGALLIDPEIAVEGLFDGDARAWEILSDIAEKTLDGLDTKARSDDQRIKESIRVALRRKCQQLTGKRPIVRIHLARV